MCRNITELRGLEPAASPDEIEAAARQYVRKVSGLQKLSDSTREPFENAVAQIAQITHDLLHQLPARRQPPLTVPPLRRPEVQARIAARAHALSDHTHADHTHADHTHADHDHDHSHADHSPADDSHADHVHAAHAPASEHAHTG